MRSHASDNDFSHNTGSVSFARRFSNGPLDASSLESVTFLLVENSSHIKSSRPQEATKRAPTCCLPTRNKASLARVALVAAPPCGSCSPSSRTPHHALFCRDLHPARRQVDGYHSAEPWHSRAGSLPHRARHHLWHLECRCVVGHFGDCWRVISQSSTLLSTTGVLARWVHVQRRGSRSMAAHLTSF